MNYTYEKIPSKIEAFQITKETRKDNSNWPEWLNNAWNREKYEMNSLFLREEEPNLLFISNLSGIQTVFINDYIIININGDIYPMSQDHFNKKYKEVE